MYLLYWLIGLLANIEKKMHSVTKNFHDKKGKMCISLYNALIIAKSSFVYNNTCLSHFWCILLTDAMYEKKPELNLFSFICFFSIINFGYVVFISTSNLNHHCVRFNDCLPPPGECTGKYDGPLCPLCCTAFLYCLSLETQHHLLPSSAVAFVLHVLYLVILFAKS